MLEGTVYFYCNKNNQLVESIDMADYLPKPRHKAVTPTLYPLSYHPKGCL
jgi:hypothetical protein